MLIIISSWSQVSLPYAAYLGTLALGPCPTKNLDHLEMGKHVDPVTSLFEKSDHVKCNVPTFAYRGLSMVILACLYPEC